MRAFSLSDGVRHLARAQARLRVGSGERHRIAQVECRCGQQCVGARAVRRRDRDADGRVYAIGKVERMQRVVERVDQPGRRAEHRTTVDHALHDDKKRALVGSQESMPGGGGPPQAVGHLEGGAGIDVPRQGMATCVAYGSAVEEEDGSRMRLARAAAQHRCQLIYAKPGAARPPPTGECRVNGNGMGGLRFGAPHSAMAAL